MVVKVGQVGLQAMLTLLLETGLLVQGLITIEGALLRLVFTFEGEQGQGGRRLFMYGKVGTLQERNSLAEGVVFDFGGRSLGVRLLEGFNCFSDQLRHHF